MNWPYAEELVRRLTELDGVSSLEFNERHFAKRESATLDGLNFLYRAGIHVDNDAWQVRAGLEKLLDDAMTASANIDRRS